MFAEIINFFTKDLGWKKILIIVGIVVGFVALAMGMVWVMFGSLGFSSALLSQMNRASQEQDKAQDKIEADYAKDRKEMNGRHEAEEQKEREQERSDEKKNEDAVRVDTPEQIEDKIMNGIDEAGKD